MFKLRSELHRLIPSFTQPTTPCNSLILTVNWILIISQVIHVPLPPIRFMSTTLNNKGRGNVHVFLRTVPTPSSPLSKAERAEKPQGWCHWMGGH